MLGLYECADTGEHYVLLPGRDRVMEAYDYAGVGGPCELVDRFLDDSIRFQDFPDYALTLVGKYTSGEIVAMFGDENGDDVPLDTPALDAPWWEGR